VTSHPNVFPALTYVDSSAAIEWLKHAFGFEEHAVHRAEDGSVLHAELQLGAGMIMLGGRRDQGPKPNPSTSSQSIYVVVPDPDALFVRARDAGATIVRELTDQEYGSREFAVRDLEGHLWSFGTYDPYQQ
jgi:uncharacterized glyoxalase superfamily protein PhnB